MAILQSSSVVLFKSIFLIDTRKNFQHGLQDFHSWWELDIKLLSILKVPASILWVICDYSLLIIFFCYVKVL